MIHRLTALLLALALLAAACGDDSTDSTDDTSTTTTTTEAPQDDPPDVEPDEPDETTTTGPEELTATDIGVTESAIRIGVVFPDNSIINRDPGDLEAKFQVMVDTINDSGGINGRVLEMSFRATHPLDDTASEATCIELTADIEVFAAIGLFPRSTADCYGAFNDTIVVNTFAITEGAMANYTAPGITTEAHPARLVETRVATLIEGGVLSEGMKIALHGGDAGREAHAAYLAALDAAGIDVVSDTIGLQTGEDLLALNDEMQRFTEVWRSSGAEAVMASASLVSQALLIAYNNADIELPMILPEGTGVAPSLLRDNQGLDLAPFELAIALVEGNNQATKYENSEDGVRECVDRFQEATGEEVALDESRNNLGPTIVACQVFDVFAQVATAAGVNLTTEAFRDAAENFGSIEVTDLAEASLGPDKFDLGDSAGVIAGFNLEAAQFEPVG
jgi:hypothetical protein